MDEPATTEATSTSTDAFASSTQNLLNLGAVPIGDFLKDDLPTGVLPDTPQGTAQPVEGSGGGNYITRAVARVHQACQNAFGSTEAIKFEFVDGSVAGEKRCILTITRPNGAVRAYTSPSAHSRKYDAKASVCTVAIESGVLDFIAIGEGAAGSSTHVPAPTAVATTPLEMDESTKTIEQFCLEWGGGRFKPQWLIINEPKFGRTQGCALQIRLGPRMVRTYSVNTIYHGGAEAKKACAEGALAEGLIDWVKDRITAGAEGKEEPMEADVIPPLTVQQFFEQLPKPFPEDVEGKTALDINGPAWLNTTIQSARGGKIVPHFIWMTDPQHGYHGCLLRLERPGECKSYLAPAYFAKRAEAKAAVCLQAMSEGVGDWVRGVAKAIEDKLSPEIRQRVTEVLMPTLFYAYAKCRNGLQPPFEYEVDGDACGASLLVEVYPTPMPHQVRKYSVPAEYRNRNDAKIALIALAVEQGVIEFLRFRGNPVPAGYVPNYAQPQFVAPTAAPFIPNAPPGFINKKRKHWEDGGNGGGYWQNQNGGGGWQNQNNGGGWQNNGGGNWQGGGGGDWHNGGGNWQNQNGGNWQNGGGEWSNKRPRLSGGFQGNNWAGPPGGGGQFGGNPYQPPPYQQPPFQGNAGGGWNQNQKPFFQKKKFQKFPKNGPGGFGGPGGPAFAGQPAGQFQPGNVGGAAPGAQPPFYGGGQPAAPQQSATPSGYNAPYPNATPAPAAAPAAAQYQYGSTSAPYTPYAGQNQAAGYQAYTPPAAQQPRAPAAPAPYVAPAAAAPPAAQPSVAGAFVPYQSPFPAQPAPPSVVAATPPSVAKGAGAVNKQVKEKKTAGPAATAGPAHAKAPVAAASAPGAAAGRPARPQPAKPIALKAAAAAPPSGAGKVTIAVESAPKTNVTALYDYCRTASMPAPQFSHEIMKGEQGESKHKVWVIIGKQKFELPVTFASLSQGQERVAKKVLEQLRLQQGKAGGAAGK